MLTQVGLQEAAVHVACASIGQCGEPEHGAAAVSLELPTEVSGTWNEEVKVRSLLAGWCPMRAVAMRLRE